MSVSFISTSVCILQTDRRSVIKDIDGELGEFEFVRKLHDGVCQVGERIYIFARFWDHREPITGEIGRLCGRVSKQ